MEGHPVAGHRTGGPQAATSLAALLVREMPGRPPGHAGQPGQTHGGRRRRQVTDPTATAAPGPPPAHHPTTAAHPAWLDTEAPHGRTTPARDSGPARPGRASLGQTRPGTRVGGAV